MFDSCRGHSKNSGLDGPGGNAATTSKRRRKRRRSACAGSTLAEALPELRTRADELAEDAREHVHSAQCAYADELPLRARELDVIEQLVELIGVLRVTFGVRDQRSERGSIVAGSADELLDEVGRRRITFQCCEVAEHRDWVHMEHPVVLRSDETRDIR